MLDQPFFFLIIMHSHDHYFHQEGEDGIAVRILEQRCFISHFVLFSKLVVRSSEMLFSVGDILNALTSVSGRKHPSTLQAKQLKMCLPMMPVVLHLVTSQVHFFQKFLNKVQTLAVSQYLTSAA